MGIETAFADLIGCIAANDARGVERAVLSLVSASREYPDVPDGLVERLLTLLRNDRLYASPLAGYLLNFFEFTAAELTPRQKSLCVGFLNAHGDQFSHFHGQQVVAELREGDYLK